MDDFLARYEVIGGKFRQVLNPLDPSSAADGTDSLAANNSKLDRVRGALAGLDLGEEVEGEDPELTARRREKERILAAVERQDREEAGKKKKDRMPMVNIVEDNYKDRWDCETVLSASHPFPPFPFTLLSRGSPPSPLSRRYLLKPLQPPPYAPSPRFNGQQEEDPLASFLRPDRTD